VNRTASPGSRYTSFTGSAAIRLSGRPRTSIMRAHRLAALLLTTLTVLSFGPAVVAAESASGDATLTVIHGLRGLLADVYLDGERVLEGFAPEQITDPLTVPAGSHDVAVREARAPETSEPALAGTITLEPGQAVTAIPHLDADGEPTLSTFVEDLTPLPAGQGRVILRHVAAGPPVDADYGDGTVLGTGIAHGDQAELVRPAGPGSVTVTGEGSDSLLVPRGQIEIGDGTTTVLYLIGSAEAGDLGCLVQRIEGLVTAPAGAAFGNSGLAAQARSNRQGLVVTVLSAALLIGLLAARNERRRART
jgi:hypothetical protein